MSRSKQKRMIVVRLSALGDVAMTIPPLYSLAKAYPHLRITMVTRPFFSRLFINCPENIDLLPVDFRSEYKGASGMWRLMRRLSALRPDYLADLHNVMRTWQIDAWMKLRGVKVAMVNKNRRARRRLFTHKESQPNYIDRYADVFARLGYPIKLTFRSLYQDTPAQPPIIPDSPAVGVAPFARYYNKTYPPEMTRRVVEILCSRGISVYLFGGRGEEENELSEWAAEIKGACCVAGKFPIDQEIALMSRMDVMVSMDSANQHLASLAGTRVVSIWGSTTPACGFMAYGQPQSSAIVIGADCQPCSVAGKPTCPLGHLDCLCRISPEQIAGHVMNLINETSDVQ